MEGPRLFIPEEAGQGGGGTGGAVLASQFWGGIMNIFPEIPPSPEVLRKLLERLALTQSDFDRFLTDYLPTAHLIVPNGVGLQTQFNSLLSQNLNETIWSALRRGYPDLLEKTRDLWATPGGLPLSTPERAQLQGQLDVLLSERQILVKWAKQTQDIDALILAKRIELKRSSSLYPGQRLGGRFQLLEFLGKGGMAEVWLALDRQPSEPGAEERRVALKILHSHHHHQTDPARERFRRGAYLMWQFKHPHIVRVRAEPQDADGYLFFPMDYLSGGTLEAKVKRERLPIDTLIRYFMEITDALHYAHTTVVTIDGQSTHCQAHRDISPLNILFDDKGATYLIDFDMASLNSQFSSDGQGGRGPLSYAAPECLSQTQKLTPDCRADVFSLALVMLFALTQREVSLDDRSNQILELISQLPYNARVRDVFTRALERDRERRFPSVEAFRTALVPAFASAAVLSPVAHRAPVTSAALVPPSAPPMPPSASLGPPAASSPARLVTRAKGGAPQASTEPRASRWLVLVPAVALAGSIGYGRSAPGALRPVLATLAGMLLRELASSGAASSPFGTASPEANPTPSATTLRAAGPLASLAPTLCSEPAAGPTELPADECPSVTAESWPSSPSPSSLASSLASSFGSPLSSLSSPLSLPLSSLLPSFLPSLLPLPWSLAWSLAPVRRQQAWLLTALWRRPESSSPSPRRPPLVGQGGHAAVSLLGAAGWKLVAAPGGPTRSPAFVASQATHSEEPAPRPIKLTPFATAQQNDEQIREATAKLHLCKCVCFPKSKATVTPPSAHEYKAMFDMKVDSQVIDYNNKLTNNPTYQITDRCVVDEIQKTLPTIPFPHSTDTFGVKEYCVWPRGALPICNP